MSKTRLDFQTFLETFKGDRKVYFQPPPSVKMSYPAIRYKLYTIDDKPADNLHYAQTTGYEMIYITKNPDDPMIHKLAQLPMCVFNRFYTADNLNHYIYIIFY